MKTSRLPGVFLWLLLVGLNFPALAAPVNRDLAVQAVRRWLELSPNPMGEHAGKIGKLKTFYNAAGEARFHLVELQPAGFVVMAADDEMEPILAFSHGGKFDGQAGNPLFDILSMDTEKRMGHIRASSTARGFGFHPQSKEKVKWEKLIAPPAQVTAATSSTGSAPSETTVNDVRVAPMLQSQWDQGYIYSGTTEVAVYNYYTPPYAAGNPGNYVCGCIATAWAQIMRFHQWPVAAVGTPSFAIYVNNVAEQMSLRGGNGAGGPYDWADMVLVPGPGLTTTQCQAIGALTFDAGVACDMGYSADGSGASLSSSTARVVFQYANAANTTSALPYMLVAIRTNLDAGLPVTLSIWEPSAGHEVVVDGYGYNLSTLYHHINMGWSGADDLWYNLPNVDGFSSVGGECMYNINPTVSGEIISGRITTLSGVPLAGIAVNLTGSTSLATTTNQSGIFAFTGLGSNSTWTVEPQGSSYVFGPAQVVVTTGSSCDFSLIGDRIADFQAGTTGQTGYLQIFLAPQNADNAGAQWQVDGGPWLASGAIVSGLLSCNHTVTFKAESGWIAPAAMTVSVNTNQLTTGLGAYLSAPIVSTLAGSCGYPGSTNGTGSNARFYHPSGVAVDGSGNVYNADWETSIVRKTTAAGVVTTLAGTAWISGTTNGTGSNALFNHPCDVAVDGNGNVYVADSSNNTIRMITSAGVVTTLAGTAGVSGTANGAGTSAQFNYPTGVAVDGSGNVYVADYGNETIREINSVGMVTTIAGIAGQGGSLDGTGTAAQFSGPTGVAVDGSGNLYVADQYNDTIREITPAGLVTTIAGIANISGSADGACAYSQFDCPTGVAVDGSGNVYVADQYNDTIREITPAGNVFTLAGSPGAVAGTDGNGSVARFNTPFGIALDTSGNLYVGDMINSTLRKITPVAITTPVVATGAATSVTAVSATLTGTVNPNGASTTAQFEYGLTNAYGNIAGVTLSPASGSTAQNVSAAISGLQAGATYHYRLDAANANGMALGNDATFSMEGVPIVTTGMVSGVTPTSATLTGLVNPNGFATTAQFEYGLTTLYGGTATVTLSPSNGMISQSVSATLSGLQPGATYHYTLAAANSAGAATGFDATFTTQVTVSTFAGTAGLTGTTNATGTAARFNSPNGVAVDGSGNVYVADTDNYAIRKITSSGLVSTFAGSSTGAWFARPCGVAVDGTGDVYVADYSSIRKITPAGIVSTFAGNLQDTTGTANGASANAQFNCPYGIAVDGSNNVYIADTSSHTIRKITSSGTVSTLAGCPGVSGTANGAGASAQFDLPTGVAVDGSGNVYVADQGNSTIRKITPAGVVSTFVGTAKVSGTSDGTGGAAQFFYPNGIAMGGNGNIYVADTFNYTVRKITSAGVVTTLAGIPLAAGSADGIGSVAQFNYPNAVTVDGSGNIYVSDGSNDTIRKITQFYSTTPTVTLLGLDPLAFEAGTSYTDPGATAMDAKGNALTPVITASTVVANQPGAYSVTWVATDSLGRTGTAVRTVEVVDTTPPVITVPADITVNAKSATGAMVSFATSAVDIVSGTVATTNNPVSGSFFPIGTTGVMTTAADAVGNIGFNMFTVTVIVPPIAPSETAAPRLAVSGSTVNITVESSVPGRNYRLQYSTDLSTWQNLGSVQVGPGGPLVISTPLNTTQSRCFYRLQLY